MRKKQVKLTVIVNDRYAGIVPQVILIDGETKMVDLEEAIIRAVREQTIHDGSNIMKISYEPGKG